MKKLLNINLQIYDIIIIWHAVKLYPCINIFSCSFFLLPGLSIFAYIYTDFNYDCMEIGK